MVQPFEKNLDHTIIDLTNILNIQDFDHKWQNFWSDQGRSVWTTSAGPDIIKVCDHGKLIHEGPLCDRNYQVKNSSVQFTEVKRLFLVH